MLLEPQRSKLTDLYQAERLCGEVRLYAGAKIAHGTAEGLGDS